MKKIIGLVLVFILVFAAASDAFAGSKPKITQQPVSATVKKGGTVSFSIKTTGSVKTVTWYFVNPATDEAVTGKDLPKIIKGLKVQKPNSKKITLSKVPESMHGWMVYAHVNGNGYKLDSDIVQLLIAGMEAPVQDQPGEEPADEEPPAAAGTGAEDEVPDELEIPANETPEKDQPSGPFTVTAGSNVLIKLDESGEPVDDEPVRSVEFDDCGSVLVTSADPIISWTLNGIRIRPDQPVNEFSVTNITSELVIDVQVQREDSAGEVPEGEVPENEVPEDEVPEDEIPEDEVPEDEIPEDEIPEDEIPEDKSPEDETPEDEVPAGEAPAEKAPAGIAAADLVVDESHMCKVTCIGCSFTYVRGRLVSVTEGEVPAGAQINISAASADMAEKGYRVNGGEPVNAGKPGFQLIVTGDVEIACR